MSASTSWMAESWSGVSSQAKDGLELAVHLIGGRKGETLAELAFGVDLQQFTGQLLDVFTGLALGFFPGDAAQLVQRRLAPLRPDIALHQAQAVYRQKQLVRSGIFQQQEVASHPSGTDVLQAPVQTDAMVDMHHVVARLEFGQRCQDLLLAYLGDAASSDPLAEQLLLGDQYQARGGEPEPARDIADEQGNGIGLRCTCYLTKARFADRAGEAVGCQQILEPFRLGLLMAGDHYALPSVEPSAQGACQRRQGVAALLGDAYPQVAVVLAGYADSRYRLRCSEDQTGKFDATAPRNERVQFGFGQKQLVRRGVRQTGGDRLGRTGGQSLQPDSGRRNELPPGRAVSAGQRGRSQRLFPETGCSSGCRNSTPWK